MAVPVSTFKARDSENKPVADGDEVTAGNAFIIALKDKWV